MIYNDTRPEGIRGTIYLSTLLLFAGYELVNVFTPNSDMIVAARILAASIYGAVIYIYAPDAFLALRRPIPYPIPEETDDQMRQYILRLERERVRQDFLILGIWLSFLSQFLQAVYAVLARLAGMPRWFVDSEILGHAVLISVVGGILHLTIPGVVDGNVPRRNRFTLGAGVAVAILIVGAVTASKPNIGPQLDLLRPWIGDWWGTTLIIPIEINKAA